MASILIVEDETQVLTLAASNGVVAARPTNLSMRAPVGLGGLPHNPRPISHRSRVKCTVSDIQIRTVQKTN
jgi:hypothetical protein